MTTDGGLRSQLRILPSEGVNERSESRLLPSEPMAPTLDRYMAQAHLAWARRHRPHLLQAA